MSSARHVYRMTPRSGLRLYGVMIILGLCILALGAAESARSLIFLVFCVAGVVLTVGGCLLLRFRVTVQGNVLTCYNYRGGKREAASSEIAAIDLAAKPWGTPTRPVVVRVPYVRLTTGSGFWLDPLVGTSAALPPHPEQVRLLDDLRQRMSVGGETKASVPGDPNSHAE